MSTGDAREKCGMIHALNSMPICCAFGVNPIPQVKQHCSYLNELSNTKPEPPLGMYDELVYIQRVNPSGSVLQRLGQTA